MLSKASDVPKLPGAGCKLYPPDLNGRSWYGLWLGEWCRQIGCAKLVRNFMVSHQFGFIAVSLKSQ